MSDQKTDPIDELISDCDIFDIKFDSYENIVKNIREGKNELANHIKKELKVLM
jgi:hypothetical protein